jgi:predicted AAA+ superfamily ATPase
MVPRPGVLREMRKALRRSPVVALVGPRQCGKTTLAREFLSPASENYFDLEEPSGLERLAQPAVALGSLARTVVIDEVQRRPDLFPVLRVLADRRPLPARFLILGSASPSLLRQSSETLAGRVEVLFLRGFSAPEAGAGMLDRLWLRGGFPRSFLARSEQDSRVWRKNFILTLLERDLPQLGVTIHSHTLLRFLTMVAHAHGGVWKSSEPARSMGVSEPTVKRYLDLLAGLFILRVLPPWHENLLKRQVKSPKVYLRDSGLLHQLLGVGSMRDLLSHPKAGASWEGMVIEEVLELVRPDQAGFWATHQGAELDLFLIKDGRRLGIEVKREDAPRLTPSMRIALDDLKLDMLTVIYPGERSYTLATRVAVVPARALAAGEASALFPGRA